jgi:threonine dehydrogenase-like Zn-dependent dehydrogenase
MNDALPETQCAVQLTGPGTARLNRAKPVHRPGPHQILCRVEAAGLCFSDLKLMAQFSAHPRKRAIVSGIAPAVLAEIASYVPGELPTVPGHEAAVRVCAAGERVDRHRVGERYLVQTDYRWLPTDGSNASFGYNFEGALQEYVLMDERVITSPEGESMLLPVSEGLSASAAALVEPWACVEDAYAEKQRRRRKRGGRAVVVAEGKAGEAAGAALREPGVESLAPGKIGRIPDASCDDIIYLGASAETVEGLFAKLAPRGLLNIALCGGRFGRKVVCPVGRAHYGGIRLVGTAGCDPARALDSVPDSAEVKEGARVHIIGAAGPMGMMHVIRVLCSGIPGVSVVGSDTDDARLEALDRIARPLAEANGVPFQAHNPSGRGPRAAGGRGAGFTSSAPICEPPQAEYIVIMVPAPALVAQAVEEAAPGAIINIFAGIPAEVTVPLDLNAYIEKRLYVIGTSGSVLEDMKTVLAKVEGGRLDTNLSVAAISGLDGAIDGIGAIEKREVAGKVIVYPWCHGLGLTRLEDLDELLPGVGKALDEGRWTKAAEEKLGEAFGR